MKPRLASNRTPSPLRRRVRRRGETWQLDFRSPADFMINGTNPLGLIDELRDLGECTLLVSTDTLPSLDLIDPTQLYLGWSATIVTDKPRSDIEDVFIFVMDEMVMDLKDVTPAIEVTASATAAPQSTDATPQETTATREDQRTPAGDAKSQRQSDNVRVPALRLDEMMDRVGELVIAQSRLSQMAGSAVDLGLRSVSEEFERLAASCVTP